MRDRMSIIAATEHADLFKPWFRERETWVAWTAFLSALFGLPMTAEQTEIYRSCTGRTEPPATPLTEGWLICGRRAGKSFILALIAVFLGCFRDYRQHLQPGERATIMVIACDRRQARVTLRYIKGLLTEIPALARLIEREAAEGFDLTNRVTIEVATTSFRTVRGYTLAAALLDEVAFWRSDDTSANPDAEILGALRPAMATIPGAMLLAASSPYARRGALWEAFRRYYGNDDAPVLVWKAPTRTMNSTVPQRVIDEAIERDPAFAAAEYLAEFRVDIEAFLSREVIEACIKPGIRERAPDRKYEYLGFVDPSGGSSDSMTLAVAHKEGTTTILDVIRERKPPFSPEAVVAEYADLLRKYRCFTVSGDRYAGEWPPEQFRKCGVHYAPAERTKSELYVDLLPMLNSAAVDLLDNDRLTHQLLGLERRTSRSGKDSIDHAPGGHDDVANAVAGVLVLCSRGAHISAWQRERDNRKIAEMTARFARSIV
jgi:hypothetical protein